MIEERLRRLTLTRETLLEFVDDHDGAGATAGDIGAVEDRALSQ
ncbi:hypothetical protein [Nonomuraea endophytica]